MNYDCEKSLELLEEFAAGELDERREHAIGQHIFSCTQCEQEFEFLSREREAFTQYLFEIEPPADLPQRFQTRLQIVEQIDNAAKFGVHVWLVNCFLALTKRPALVFAGLAVIFGAALVSFQNSVGLSPTELTVASSQNEIRSGEQLSAAESVKTTPATIESAVKSKTSTVYTKFEAVKGKTSQKSPAKISGYKNPDRKNNEPKLAVAPAEDLQARQIRELQNLEIETAKNIEKIEMLLRSFRNARVNDDNQTVDVGYESQQARRLLKNVVNLRQKAENYGSSDTVEVLSRVEPYLLEISNLDQQPRLEEVLEIKRRVKEQNFIANLQTYSSL